ncbi:Pentatricopeptide repeat-containing protein [Forsythia ovata]|uniref:Pentatricopeptide repeat-containing protein n=1 Tax=Forsythia ovata TaxID=205694 RepID=A0ABD1W5D6_9LAMI
MHAQMLIHSIHKPTFLLSKLILLKDFEYSTLFFSQIPNVNDYDFSIMIRGLTTTWQKFNLALEYYGKMKSLGVKPDNFTYPFVFISCGNLLALKIGRLAHSEVVRNGLCSYFHVVHSLIIMYSRCGQLDFAQKLFDEMGERDLVSWNSMISGYSRMGFAKEAVELFGEMREEGLEPGEMSLVSVLGACGDLGALNLGRWIEEYVMEKGMELNTYIGSALIDMYGKCGDLVSTRRVFDGMRKEDVITWNAMITGYAQNGLSDGAISLFNAMKEAGTDPNEVTLIEVLSACASIGSMDFEKWIDEYTSKRGFHNDVYVATALVDMYAKCGNLDHAFQVFENIACLKKNEVSWNAMISALAFHGRAQEAPLLFKRMSHEGGAARPNDITFVGLLSACVHVGLVDEGHRLFDLMSSSYGLVPKLSIILAWWIFSLVLDG